MAHGIQRSTCGRRSFPHRFNSSDAEPWDLYSPATEASQDGAARRGTTRVPDQRVRAGLCLLWFAALSLRLYKRRPTAGKLDRTCWSRRTGLVNILVFVEG